MSGVMEGGGRVEYLCRASAGVSRGVGGWDQPEDGRVDCLENGTYTPSHSLLSGILLKGWCLSGRPASQIAH